ncbi:hypothetical protein EWM59_14090 [Emticicia agri]|uniref:Lipoprotein n=2 Tax=Emticicia agri TaxID=2492393 RepID=A0A4Q5LZA0_9BACT|nr:hypothetical protein EWM59_14090 [Emticicia agri]
MYKLDMKSSIVLIFISSLLSACTKGPIVRTIEIDATKDTTLLLEKRGGFDSAGLKVIGNINDSALIRMQHPDERNFNLHKDLILTKGYNNSKQGLTNLYDRTFKIVYFHKNVSEGKLKLTINF